MKFSSFRPMRDKIFVTDFDEGVHVSKGGIILQDDMGKDTGIRPRWARVHIVGEDVDIVSVGEWVLVEHGRWTKRIPLELDDGGSVDIWMIDPAAIMVAADKNHSNERITLA